MLDCQHFDDPQVRSSYVRRSKDLKCAGSHVSDALKLMGWTADDRRLAEVSSVAVDAGPLRQRKKIRLFSIKIS